jgi:hypothetical protein
MIGLAERRLRSILRATESAMTKLEQLEKTVSELEDSDFALFPPGLKPCSRTDGTGSSLRTPIPENLIDSQTKAWQISALGKQRGYETPRDTGILEGL